MKLKNPLVDALTAKKITLPKPLRSFNQIAFKENKASNDTPETQKHFPKTHSAPYLETTQTESENKAINVGVVFSGGQAPGGHNVIAGLYDALKTRNTNSQLIGFLGGPGGFMDNSHITLDDKILSDYRNIGGFDLIGSGRTKIEKPEDFKRSLEVAKEHKLDAFVIIGGDDSNTNAALLAEFFKSEGQPTAVIGVPKTIDGDLMNQYVEVSFGFDTATKVYSELIGNICTDAKSAKKYYHFIKLMGRSASHITLECALKTQVNYAFIAEEIQEKNKSLQDLAEELSKIILKRAHEGKNFGVILIPEGLIDFIPELSKLNEEINHLLATDPSLNADTLLPKLSEPLKETFSSLPKEIQHQLLLTRDPHGNIQLSKIDTQKLIMGMVEELLSKHESKQVKFNPVSHFLGYEGRCAHPSLFDAEYTYALGYTAALLALGGHTGYMAAIKNLKASVEDWEVYGLPITSLINLENRHGKLKPVIKKALVDLKSAPFLAFASRRESWALEDSYNAPGPIQYFGDPKITQIKNSIVELT